MVRATFSARCVARALQPRRVAAVFKNLGAAVASMRAGRWPCPAAPGWAPLAPGTAARSRPRSGRARMSSRGLAWRGLPAVRSGGSAGHFHMQVDAVQQRARSACPGSAHLVGRAAAGLAMARAQVAAGAGVHGADQLEARRKLRPRAARAMVMWPVSSGSRRASRAARGNSGSSSRKSTP
jgi:hypothetical protein